MSNEGVRISIGIFWHKAQSLGIRHSVPCALRPVPCALRPVPCALRPVPCALRPVPCALCLYSLCYSYICSVRASSICFLRFGETGIFVPSLSIR